MKPNFQHYSPIKGDLLPTTPTEKKLGPWRDLDPSTRVRCLENRAVPIVVFKKIGTRLMYYSASQRKWVIQSTESLTIEEYFVKLSIANDWSITSNDKMLVPGTNDFGRRGRILVTPQDYGQRTGWITLKHYSMHGSVDIHKLGTIVLAEYHYHNGYCRVYDPMEKQWIVADNNGITSSASYKEGIKFESKWKRWAEEKMFQIHEKMERENYAPELDPESSESLPGYHRLHGDPDYERLKENYERTVMRQLNSEKEVRELREELSTLRRKLTHEEA